MSVTDATNKITVLRLKPTSLLSHSESLRVWRSPGMCTACLLAVIPLLREVEKDRGETAASLKPNSCVCDLRKLCRDPESRQKQCMNVKNPSDLLALRDT